MARQNFTTQIAGGGSRHGSDGSSQTYNIGNARFASETIVGVKRRKPQGWKTPTPYTFDRVEYQMLNGTCNLEYWDGRKDVFVGYCDGGTLNRFNESFILNPSWSALSDQALVKARLAMKDTDVNLGVAFAERNATARMVGDNAMAIAKAVRQLRRGNFKDAARALGFNRPGKPRGNSVTQRWLELQYGWKPLLSDVYGATEALAKRPNDDWRVTGKGNAKVDVLTPWKVGGSDNSACETMCRGAYGCYVRIDAIPTNDLLRSLSSLGITNPLLIGWELVPFSFVVDWFLPIGSYLDSLDAMLGYSSTSYSSTNWAKLRWSTRGHTGTNGGSTFWRKHVNAVSAHKTQVYVRRTVGTSVPLPTLPRFKDPRSLAHMANGLSLLAQAFSGMRK